MTIKATFSAAILNVVRGEIRQLKANHADPWNHTFFLRTSGTKWWACRC